MIPMFNSIFLTIVRAVILFLFIISLHILLHFPTDSISKYGAPFLENIEYDNPPNATLSEDFKSKISRLILHDNYNSIISSLGKPTYDHPLTGKGKLD